MKKIRAFMTVAGLVMGFLALAATGANAQKLSSAQFVGTFSVPLKTQWGSMTLPAGDYSLQYGRLFSGGVDAVQVVGKAKGMPGGWILTESTDPSSATEDSLICVRDGDSLVVRGLELPAIGVAVSFALPHGEKVLAYKQNPGKYTLAEAPMLIQRVPVTLQGK